MFWIGFPFFSDLKLTGNFKPPSSRSDIPGGNTNFGSAHVCFRSLAFKQNALQKSF